MLHGFLLGCGLYKPTECYFFNFHGQIISFSPVFCFVLQMQAGQEVTTNMDRKQAPTGQDLERMGLESAEVSIEVSLQVSFN
jgi:hypothetical protein